MSSKAIQIQAEVNWRYRKDKTSGFYIAECKELGLVVTGETHALMVESINESLDLLFNELLSSGDLEKFLRENKWQLQSTLPSKRNQSPVTFDVPYRLTERRGHLDTEGALCK